jgi:uncharacterized protein (DUF1800 family)
MFKPEFMRFKRHLYFRAGFGLTVAEEEYVDGLSIPECVTGLLNVTDAQLRLKPGEANIVIAKPDRKTISMMSREKKTAYIKQNRQALYELVLGWMSRMTVHVRKGSPLFEKMVFFWHGHFACAVNSSSWALDYLMDLRTDAFGKFRDLVVGVARNGAMLSYLNNNQNTKASPNENFARELLELFTIGIGNYSERDIQEAARAFTGWKYKSDKGFYVNNSQHDGGVKTFMGKTGNFTGEDIIDIILEQRACAEFITRKVYSYFMGTSKGIDDLVASGAKIFYESGYEIKELLGHLFLNDQFYAHNYFGIRIKSPVELMAGMMKSLNIKFERPLNCTFLLKLLGQIPFQPPSVAGWDGGESWINSSTILIRLNLINFITGEANMMYTGTYVPEGERFKLNPKRFKDLEYSYKSFTRVQERGEEWPLALKRNLLNVKSGGIQNSGKDIMEFSKSVMHENVRQIMKSTDYQMC